MRCSSSISANSSACGGKVRSRRKRLSKRGGAAATAHASPDVIKVRVEAYFVVPLDGLEDEPDEEPDDDPAVPEDAPLADELFTRPLLHADMNSL